MRFSKKFWMLLVLVVLVAPAWADEVPAHLREAAKNLSRTYTINYDESRKLDLTLPEGYLIRRESRVGEDLVLCPWNEFFIISSSRMPASSGQPVNDETAMSVELDEFKKAHTADGGELKASKVWMTAKGPMATFEVWTTAEKKTNVGSLLAYPVGSELWLFSLVGSESSLEDQKIIQNLLIEELLK